MTETRITSFRIGLPQPAFLFANDRQQLTVNIFISLETRATPTSNWASRQPHSHELNSLTLVDPSADSAMQPPSGWRVVANRNEYAQGYVRGLSSGQSDGSGESPTEQEQRRVDNTPLPAERMASIFLMTSVVQHMNFTAGIIIDGLGWITATRWSNNNSNSKFSFQSTLAQTIRARYMQRRSNELLHDYGKNEWRGLVEFFWLSPGHIPILREIIEGELIGGANQVHRQTARWNEVFAGVLRSHVGRFSHMTPNQMTYRLEPRQGAPREPHRPFPFSAVGAIRSYIFYDSHIGHGQTRTSQVRVTLVDIAGNESRFVVVGDHDPQVNDA